MGKGEIVQSIFDTFTALRPNKNLPTSLLRQIITKYFEEIHMEIMNTGLIRIPALGSWKVYHAGGRKYCDLKTREQKYLPGRHRLKFTPSRSLRQKAAKVADGILPVPAYRSRTIVPLQSQVAQSKIDDPSLKKKKRKYLITTSDIKTAVPVQTAPVLMEERLKVRDIESLDGGSNDGEVTVYDIVRKPKSSSVRSNSRGLPATPKPRGRPSAAAKELLRKRMHSFDIA